MNQNIDRAVGAILAIETATPLTESSTLAQRERHQKLLHDETKKIEQAFIALAQPPQCRAVEIAALSRFLQMTPLAVGPLRKRVICRAEPLKDDAHEQEIASHFNGLLLRLAKGLLASALNPAGIPWRRRVLWLEKAAHIAHRFDKEPLADDKERTEAAGVLARCCLHLALAHLPKGKDKSAMAERQEDLLQSLMWAQKAIVLAGQDKLSGEEYKLLKALVLIELDNLSPGRFQQQLNYVLYDLAVIWLERDTATKPFHPQELFVLWRYLATDFEPDLNMLLFKGSNTSERTAAVQQASPEAERFRPLLPLIHAWSAWKLDPPNNKIAEVILQAVNNLDEHQVYEQVWKWTVDFLQELRNTGAVDWQLPAIAAWELCNKKEKELPFGFQIRQYWSRLDSLYRLAFDGALELKDCMTAARIVDSLKSRTPLTWRDMDTLFAKLPKEKADQLREAFYSMEVQARMGFYAEAKEDANKLKKLLAAQVRKIRDIESVPAGWTVVHFHLREDQDLGYALACRLTADGMSYWTNHIFPVAGIRRAYDCWLEAYHGMEPGAREKSGYQLVELSEIMGKDLDFLFELAGEDGARGLLFVPHGFSHLLPLHAAKKDGSYLFEKIPSLTLPAWEFAPDVDQIPVSDGQDFCFISQRANEQDLVGNIERSHTWNGVCNKNAAWTNVLNTNKEWSKAPPRWLVFWCHGQADPHVAFRSKLLLGTLGVSLFEIQEAALSLTGTKVVLAVCESDLAPPEEYEKTDDHLSLAAPFLLKGARQVLAAIWEGAQLDLLKAMKEMLSNQDKHSWEILRELQSCWMRQPGAIFNDEYIRLYYAASFRILGFPEVATTNMATATAQEEIA
ncbi:MAG: hypothetical protein A2511_12455 [Deltaproteobacteria bacterium RIFOXYD12_FULL_50_9]|nr:MAG: hypothetical protein A2511_12455 [Deltaproteobacteria bacterium RIFOXYD12_FULL_50_9]